MFFYKPSPPRSINVIHKSLAHKWVYRIYGHRLICKVTYFPVCVCVCALGRACVLAFACMCECLYKQICQSSVRCGFAEKLRCDLKGDRERTGRGRGVACMEVMLGGD